MHSFLYSLLWFIIVITPIVFIHELGHFYFARLFGVHVEVFSIGFGRPLVKWHDKKGTKWQIGIIPLGGYVKMFGDDNESSVPDYKTINALSKEDRQKSFHCKKLWQKFIIVFAGPFANYVLSFIIIAALFMTRGTIVTTTEVDEVIENTPAYHAGIKPGDFIASLNSVELKSFDDLKGAIALNTGESISLGIIRNGQYHDIKLTPEIIEFKDIIGNKVKMPQLGMKFSNISYIKTDFIDSLILATKKIYTMSKMMLVACMQMILGQRGTDDLGGPIKIAQYSMKFAQEGIIPIFLFIAGISLNLGLINLFPIPMLDGGHLFYYIIEAIIRRPINHKVQAFGFRVGFILIIALMAFGIWNDIKSVLFKN